MALQGQMQRREKVKKRLMPIVIILTYVICSLCGCSEEGSVPPETTTTATEATTAVTEATTTVSDEEKIPEGALFVDFSRGEPSGFEIADGWTNGSIFNVTWRKRNISFENGRMQLIIDNDGKGKPIPYSGGEFRSRDFYGYGRYEVSMKPIKNDGVVSSFFTYTGPSDNNPWDEIDIEFLGKDTTIVQFNYFTNGVGEREFIYDLGFDASEEFHTYAFEWHKDKIIWFVDGKAVYTAYENIPSVKGKIMMNAWCGTGVDEWLNPFDDSSLPLTAEYEHFSFTPFDE